MKIIVATLSKLRQSLQSYANQSLFSQEIEYFIPKDLAQIELWLDQSGYEVCFLEIPRKDKERELFLSWIQYLSKKLKHKRKLFFFYVDDAILLSPEEEEWYLQQGYVFSNQLSRRMWRQILAIIQLHMENESLRSSVLQLGAGMGEATGSIRTREGEILLRLALAASTRDKETGNHIYRVGAYSHLLAQSLGLSQNQQDMIKQIAPVHDVGKIAIADVILQKKGIFTPEEREVMKTHTIHGYKILHSDNIPILKEAAEIAIGHHERWDGEGYPYGKKGEQIPLFARITMVADVFDAFSSKRRYKEAWSLDQSFEQLQNEAGKAFDPQLVEAFVKERKQVEAIFHRLKDPS